MVKKGRKRQRKEKGRAGFFYLVSINDISSHFVMFYFPGKIGGVTVGIQYSINYNEH